MNYCGSTAIHSLVAGCLLPSLIHAESPLSSFSTGGHTVYHVKSGTVEKSGARVVISAAYDGSVLCQRPSGELVWKADTDGAFPFDLCVKDLDGDGRDEVLVASADGALRVFDPDGKKLWSFARTAPLFQVCVASQKDGSCVVMTGGEDQTIHVLSTDGKLRKDIPLGVPIRHLRAGDILGDKRDVVAVATTTGALAGKLTISLFDPVDMKQIWSRTDLGAYAPNSGRRFFSMVTVDLDHDGKQEIVCSGSWGDHGKIYAYDSQGDLLFAKSDPRVPNVPYRMNLLVPVKLPNDECIIGQFANILIVYNLDGTCREVVTGPYAYANAGFDPATRTLYLGSSIAGGDAVHALHLDQAGWQQAFADAKPVGRLAEIIDNMGELRGQIAQFKAPLYQPKPRIADILLMDEYHNRTPEQLRRTEFEDRKLNFVSHLTFGQKHEEGALWCHHRSAFSTYDMTADELVAEVRKWEARKRYFALQTSHTTAFHMSLDTMKRVIEAAPEYLWGFELSEPGEQLDEMEANVVDQIVIPLAEECLKHGRKKILLRTKNIFWNGNVYREPWHDLLMNPRYRGIFIPCLEETNSRTQESSLAGRIGLWQTGMFDRWACRAETDNSCFDRMWEWSSQQVFSHHLRNLVSCAALGSDVYFNGIHQGPFSADLETQLFPFYDMLEKGIVQIPERSQLASLSPLAIGMRIPPDPSYIWHGTNGHRETFPTDEHPPLVFDRLDCYWGGAPLADYDFSSYAFGVKRRMCNFLPTTPFGMVAIIPDDAPAAMRSRFSRKISTDGRYFYDEDGKAHGPAEYQPVVEAALKQAADQMPIRVEGTAHYAASWLDAKHLRVTLIDPGYLDPAARDVAIVLQSEGWTVCRDILRAEDLPISEQRIALRIPAGTMRIVDLTRD